MPLSESVAEGQRYDWLLPVLSVSWRCLDFISLGVRHLDSISVLNIPLVPEMQKDILPINFSEQIHMLAHPYVYVYPYIHQRY